MPLSTGDRLGPYEILGPLGAGGMGEVYRALDTKLHREVAVKVLPASLANDAQYMARFEREAQTLAALNHPNVATVYGIEQGAIVMELVEGHNLRGPLPLDEAIPIARQIALGLEAAHERGIIHRDLKPANIRITPSGVVKLLDFGLAKSAVEAGANSGSANQTNSPTLSMEMTQAGMILGTAAYMAPEQARGKSDDKRADIWAFRVVLYEMLTGKKLFECETVSDVLAAVLKEEPDLTSAPVEVRRLLRSCLKKIPGSACTTSPTRCCFSTMLPRTGFKKAALAVARRRRGARGGAGCRRPRRFSPAFSHRSGLDAVSDPSAGKHALHHADGAIA